MVIIYGRRAYGRVDAQDGEFADTQFAHFDFVPLFPIGSHWITQDASGERIGFPIKLHLRSVAATYLRTWALGLAVILLVSSESVAAFAASCALLALSAWSWTWRTRRTALSRRRGDFDRVALGSRCEPALLTNEMHERVERSLKARHALRADARPPDDVARFGAKDVDEAVVAYGLLRLSAVRHRPAAAAAERLLTSAFDSLPSDGGPYREAANNATELGGKIVEAAHAATETARAAAQRSRAAARPRWFQRPWVQLVLLLWITPGIGAIAIETFASRPRTIGAVELALRPPHHKQVRVACDEAEPGVRTSATKHVTLCWLGGRALPVVSGYAPPDDASEFHGELRDIPRSAPWAIALHDVVGADTELYGVYLSTAEMSKRSDIALTCLLGLGVIAGWVFWIRALWLRRRARAANP